MTIALPLLVDDDPSSTCFVAGSAGGRLLLVTSLHQLGTAKKFAAAIPPHGGDISVRQVYPLQRVPYVELGLLLCDHVLDLAVLVTKDPLIPPPRPRFLGSGLSPAIGEDMFVIGYPFAPIGSFPETMTSTTISSLGIRAVSGVPYVKEFTVNVLAHIGLSGSPVIRKSDGVVCGVLRGCISPPAMMMTGSIPLGNDSTIAVCVVSDYIPSLISQATVLINA